MLTIRPMQDSDLSAVLEIERRSYPHPWKRDHFLHELSAPHSFPFVAFDESGAVVGYLCLMSLFEEAQVLNLAVAPEQRGRGVGRLLMERAVELAREKGAGYLALEVRSSNVAAIGLYESFGFIRCGLRPCYYEGVEDAVLMEKPLQGANGCSLPQ